MSPSMKRRDLMKNSTLFALGMLGAGHAHAQDEDPFPHMKIELASPNGYSPLRYLQTVKENLKPEYAFTAATREDALAWSTKARARLWEILGESHVPKAVMHNARLLEKPVACDGYTREKWVIDIESSRQMPFYVLKPLKSQSRYKTAICLHGHGNGAKDIIGMPIDKETEEFIKLLSLDYAVQAAKRGWYTVAPELWCFGERLDFVQGARAGFDGGCEKPHLNAIEVGKCSIGIRAKDIATLIDWIAARDECDMNDLACIGLSGGGMMTMYASALDERIKRVMIVGYLSEMKGSILGIRHCGCNYVPHLAKYFDFPDITSLIAPRMLVGVSGIRDAIFPIDSFRAAAAKVADTYRIYGQSGRFTTVEHKGFHSFYTPALDSFLA